MTFWVYANNVHKFAKVHRGGCAFCKEGRGVHDRGADAVAGGWLGPFESVASARHAAERTGHPVQGCSVCTPT